MQQAVDTGKDKVKKICEILRKETLEPAVDEAKALLEESHKKGQKIIEDAKGKAEKIIADAEKEIEKRHSVFNASLNQGARQAVQWLKQEIEERLLNENLYHLISKSSTDPDVLAKMITAVIKGIEDEGLDADLSAFIPSAIEAKEVNELLGQDMLEKLREKSVIIGSKKGGIEIKLHKENITIDLTDTALLELITRYIRKDFHQYFFTEK